MVDQQAIQIFGEVLFDHFPDGSRVLGGAPFNVAWHLQAFGLAPCLISRIGDDDSGREIVKLMTGWGMSRTGLQIDHEHPTGSVKVLIEKGEPHYDIVADSAYDFIDVKQLDQRNTEGVLYHGSLALRNLVSRAALEGIKARHRGKIFVDVNLRPPWWDKDLLMSLLLDADWVKLNEAELTTLWSEAANLEMAMQDFSAKFDLDTLIVTCGEKGAIACDRHRHFVTVKPAASIEVMDTVGAGDAFAALLILGLHRQWPLQATLERAQAFASALVGRRGATVADRVFYRSFSEQWA